MESNELKILKEYHEPYFMRKKFLRLLFEVIVVYQKLNCSYYVTKLGLTARSKGNNNNNNNNSDNSSYGNGNIVAANKEGTIHHIVTHRNNNNDDGNNEEEEDLDRLVSWDIAVGTAVVIVTALVFTAFMVRSRSR